MEKFEVNGLPLPSLLIELIQSNKWKHPGDEIIHSVIDYLHEPVDFLPVDAMARETSGIIADDPRSSNLFHEVRGSKQTTPIELPWLDIEKAVFIAVNRVAGDDLIIALDYRTNQNDPRVVANDWWSVPNQCIWHEVSPTFSQFVEQINLLKNKS